MTEKSIRAAQLIAPFGPGSVVDLGGESFTCMDISRWTAAECPKLPDNALERVLGKVIRRPPAADQTGAVPFSRFPRWVFCPSCRRLYNYSHAQDEANNFKPPLCSNRGCSNSPLVPMRFVVVCDQGHLQDVDWFRWAHRNSQVAENGQCSRQTAELIFKTSGASGGDFNAMEIECKSCGNKNSFVGLTNAPYPFGCNGRQPWEAYRQDRCPALPKVVPRAASNVYYPQTRSALDIGAEVEGNHLGNLLAFHNFLGANQRIASLRTAVTVIPGWEDMLGLYSDLIDVGVRDFGLLQDDAHGAVVSSLRAPIETGPSVVVVQDKSQHSLLMSEWPYFAKTMAFRAKNFRTEVHQLDKHWPREYAVPFDHVTLVSRLREVRALIGFKRVRPDDGAAEVQVDLGSGLNWLPGVETFGEGIFIKLSESFIRQWEVSVVPLRKDRTAKLASICGHWGREPAVVYSSPRFIALHTLSHGLIRRLAFDAGYSSSSIRERIYCGLGSDSAAGILLYTSDGDSEGSLGGLVRQGQPERLLGTLKRTLADLSWCSADPVCSEMEEQGIDGMNSAACHACALISETSCIFNNSLLDRRLLIGSPARGFAGLLSGLAERVD